MKPKEFISSKEKIASKEKVKSFRSVLQDGFNNLFRINAMIKKSKSFNEIQLELNEFSKTFPSLENFFENESTKPDFEFYKTDKVKEIEEFNRLLGELYRSANIDKARENYKALETLISSQKEA